VPELPPPLPPERRTVGQLVAESIRAYGQSFWRCLPLGVPLAVADQLNVHRDPVGQSIVLWLLAPLFVAAYLWGCRVVLGAQPTVTAAAIALLVFLPFPALRRLYILPGLAWFALIGLAVPAAMVARTGLRDSLVRGRRLGLADYPHALGSLAALVVVVGLSANVLGALLHAQGDAGLRAGVFVSDVVLSPLLYLGAAILYLDQAARLTSSSDAGVRPPLDAEPSGRPDAQVEP
jgi:hypothetical protein